MGSIAVAVCFAFVAATSWLDVVSDRVSMAITIVGGGIILVAWFGVPLPIIGFGGFTASAIIAVLSLKTRNRQSASI